MSCVVATEPFEIEVEIDTAKLPRPEGTVLAEESHPLGVRLCLERIEATGQDETRYIIRVEGDGVLEDVYVYLDDTFVMALSDAQAYINDATFSILSSQVTALGTNLKVTGILCYCSE